MPIWADMALSGWGRVLRSTSQVARPERMRELTRHLQEAPAPVLVRGNGRSYGDAAQNGQGHVILTTRLDRLIELDEAAETITVEAGARFGDLVNTLLPRGFVPAVVPGTGFATVGGGLANDVHGKNHHQVGSIGQQLQWLELRTPDGVLHRLLGDDDTEALRATLGGVGLTGAIERACLKLLRVPSNAVTVRRERMAGLDEFLHRLQTEQERSPYVVGWIDALARGAQLGRGILEMAAPAQEPVPEHTVSAKKIPFDFPSFVLNPLSVKLFNELYFRRIPSQGRTEHLPFSKFLFPLDTLHEWNRIYGQRGFHQFQCVVPFEAGASAMRQMLELIASSGLGSFLAVLKSMGSAGRGYLSFPQPGFTLALDFPNGRAVLPLIDRLEAITCDHGGRTYLAKDSTVSAQRIEQMYPQIHHYREVLARLDPQQRMASDLGRRLRLRGEPLA